MINKRSILVTSETNPYKNLSLEEYLTFHVEVDEVILYLWQNLHTVVIGQNQNCWKECKVNYLEENNLFLVRRLSGGGAVFHDIGNLNFTFIAKKENYDLNKQLAVILKAVELLGIVAEKTGRNDIMVDGRKFSGNAFYESNGFCYHHGTILLNVDTENMSKYLNVSKEKLQSKGVESVKSRVINLIELYPDLSVSLMKDKLREAFSIIYEGDVSNLDLSRVNTMELVKLEQKFSSWKWKYGKKIKFQFEMQERFAWGDIEIQFCVNSGKIIDLNVFSDAMEERWILEVPKALIGCIYSETAILETLDSIPQQNPLNIQMCEDVKNLIRKKL